MDLADDDDESFLYEEDKIGMSTTSGIVKIVKDDDNLIGISIGGGSPYCPCTYIIQVFDNTPTSRSGLEAGDEIVAVNSECVKGKTKKEVAKRIQESAKEVIIKYNKLHLQEKQGKKNFDIYLKKVKHRIVENMSSSTADALGLSRAILCNDSLSKKMEELEQIEFTYKELIDHIRHLLKAYLEISHIYKAFGDVFSEIGVKEQQPSACESFSKFGESHRRIEKKGIEMLKGARPVLMDLCTFLYKVLPDTKLTVKKYEDIKFEYLSYCLKVKEMDNEEVAYQAMQEPLYRVETGNYEYRLVLRCRQEARARFVQMRSDLLVKLDLLEQKHNEMLALQLQKFMKEFNKFYDESQPIIKDNKLFPIEVDLPRTSLDLELKNQQATFVFTTEYRDEETDEANNDRSKLNDDGNNNNNNTDKDKDKDDLIEPELLAEFNAFQLDSSNELNLIDF